MKVLLAKVGPLAGNSFPIGGRTLIGRDADCDIQVIDKGVSRKHACVIEQDDGSVLVRDLRSHNCFRLATRSASASRASSTASRRTPRSAARTSK
jgi:predicted component of type VI protein secretion system